MCFYVRSLFCVAVLCVHSSFTIISLGKRESWWFYFCCVLNIISLLLLYDSSLQCHGLVCNMCMWYFLAMLTDSLVSLSFLCENYWKVQQPTCILALAKVISHFQPELNIPGGPKYET